MKKIIFNFLNFEYKESQLCPNGVHILKLKFLNMIINVHENKLDFIW